MLADLSLNLDCSRDGCLFCYGIAELFCACLCVVRRVTEAASGADLAQHGDGACRRRLGGAR